MDKEELRCQVLGIDCSLETIEWLAKSLVEEFHTRKQDDILNTLSIIAECITICHTKSSDLLEYVNNISTL